MTKKTRTVKSDETLIAAGIGAEGHGVLTAFGGDGPLPRVKLLDMYRRCGIEEAWFPAVKEAKTQLTRAIEAIAKRNGFSVEQELKKNRQTLEAREWEGCWHVWSGRMTSPKRAGDSVGTVVFTVTLFDDERGQEIDVDDGEHPAGILIREEFQRLADAQIYSASDITGHLARIHQELLGGVKYGGGNVYYVPREHRAIAEQIAEVFWGEERYGCNWFYPPLPVGTSVQLQLGIANGLCAELTAQLALLELRRRQTRMTSAGYSRSGRELTRDEMKSQPSENYAYNKEGERVDIGATAAQSFAIRFARVWERVNKYAAQIGPEMVDMCGARMHDAMIEIHDVLPGGATNADGSFRDLALEEARAEQAGKPEVDFPGVVS